MTNKLTEIQESTYTVQLFGKHYEGWKIYRYHVYLRLYFMYHVEYNFSTGLNTCERKWLPVYVQWMNKNISSFEPEMFITPIILFPKCLFKTLLLSKLKICVTSIRHIYLDLQNTI